MATVAKEYNQAVQYAIFASEHSGDDFALWLRYLRKWVNKSGHIFSVQDVAEIMGEERIRPVHRTIFSEAITPGTPTNQYVTWLNEPVDTSEILERIRIYAAN